MPLTEGGHWLVPVLAVLLAACGGAGMPEPTAECIATPESGDAIAQGLTVGGGGTLRDVFAVPLPEDSGFAYVVAAEIDGPGIEGDGDIGTWAVNELGGGGLIIAADHVAQEFSEWGAAATDGSPIDEARDAIALSDEAAAAEACAESG